MREIIINQYLTGQINVNDALNIIEQYMKAVNKENPKIIEYIANPSNPFATDMLLKAYNVAKDHFEPELSILKYTDPETGKVLYAG